MIHIAIADDEALFRKGMTLLINDYEDLQISLDACDGQDLLDKLENADPMPEVLLLDLNMPNLNGIKASKVIRDKYPDLKIIIISTYFSDAFVMNMIELGAASYLPKNTEPSLVASTIREVQKQGFSYSTDIQRVIRDNMQKKKKSRPITNFKSKISAREMEVLQLICQEYTTAEIADVMFVSPRTVDGHRNNLMSKLGVRNTAGLVVFAVQNQLVQVNPDKFHFGK